MITQEQLKELQERVEALYKYLDIPRKQMEYEEEQLRTQAPDFWEDAKRAEEQMKKVKSLEKWIKGYDSVHTFVEELSTAFDFYKEELVTEEEVDEIYAKTIAAIEDLELKNMLRQEEDPMDAVLKINSGAGGTEAQDWAQMLMRMYMRWAEAHGYKVTIANLLDGEDAGIKSVTMQMHDVVCFRIRYPAGRRHHRGLCRPREAQLGHVPFVGCRWSERQQGGVGRTSALLVHRPRYGRRGGNPH